MSKKELFTEWLKDCPVYYNWDNEFMGVVTIGFDISEEKT